MPEKLPETKFLINWSGAVNKSLETMLTPDQQRVKDLLCETITLLCKNGLHFQTEFSIDALIGITLDQSDVFLVTIKETVHLGDVFVRDKQRSVSGGEQSQSMGRARTASKFPQSTDTQKNAREIVNDHVSEKDIGTSHPTKTFSNSTDDKTDPNSSQSCVETKMEELYSNGNKNKPAVSTLNQRFDSDASVAEPGMKEISSNMEDEEDENVEMEDNASNSNQTIIEDDHRTAFQESKNSTTSNLEDDKINPEIKLQEAEPCRSSDLQNRSLLASQSKFVDYGNESDEDDDEEPVVIKIEPPEPCFRDNDFSYRSGHENSRRQEVQHASQYSIWDSPHYAVKPDVNPLFMTQNHPNFQFYSQRANQEYHQYPSSIGFATSSTQNDHDRDLESDRSVPFPPGDLCTNSNQKMLSSSFSTGLNIPNRAFRHFPGDAAKVQPDDEIGDAHHITYLDRNRKQRSSFTISQIQRLETVFETTHYVDSFWREKLSKELNLPESTIIIWFQNRRQKLKKQQMQMKQMDNGSSSQPFPALDGGAS